MSIGPAPATADRPKRSGPKAKKPAPRKGDPVRLDRGLILKARAVANDRGIPTNRLIDTLLRGQVDRAYRGLLARLDRSASPAESPEVAR